MIPSPRAMHECPSDDTMAAFVEGRLDAEEAASVHRHIDGCQTCQWLLRELAGPPVEAPRAPARSRRALRWIAPIAVLGIAATIALLIHRAPRSNIISIPDAALVAPPPVAHPTEARCEGEWPSDLAAALCTDPESAMWEAAFRVLRELRADGLGEEARAALRRDRGPIEADLRACGGARPCLIKALRARTPGALLFNCARPRAIDEKLACGSVELARLEGALVAAYIVDKEEAEGRARRRERAALPTAAELVTAQNGWFAERHRCGDSAECLEAVYRTRLADLLALHRRQIGSR